MKMALRPWYQCFYTILFIAAFLPFLLFYFKFTIPTTFYVANKHSQRQRFYTQRIEAYDRSIHDRPVPTTYVKATVIGQLNATGRTEANQHSQQNGIIYQEYGDEPVDYNDDQSYRCEIKERAINHVKTVDHSKLKKPMSEYRKGGKFELNVGVDLWQYVNDTTVKYNGTRYPDVQKTELMKKYYPLLFKEFTKHRLPNYKTPCFCKSHHSITCPKAWACLPYFYLIGAPKSGTTDLWYQIHRHPTIQNNHKEPHWWTRRNKDLANIFGYFENQRILVDKMPNAQQGSNLIIGDGSASTLWDNLSIMKKSTASTGQLSLPFTWADVIHSVQPDARIIAVLRNPVNRVISDYFAFHQNQSPEEFQTLLLGAMKAFKSCLKKCDLRFCANLPYYPRIQIGLYVVHLQEWFDVFPRDQMFLLRTEDWHLHRQMRTLPRLFHFLDIEPITDEALPPLSERAADNINAKAVTRKNSHIYGDIWTLSKQLLEQFYRPYNQQLAALLKDPRFLWIDAPAI